MNQLDNKIIENALALTGKTMGDMEEPICLNGIVDFYDFSYPKFFYYLLSPEFIEKYHRKIKYSKTYILERMGKAIYEYQSGNEEPLKLLLSKIGN